MRYKTKQDILDTIYKRLEHSFSRDQLLTISTSFIDAEMDIIKCQTKGNRRKTNCVSQSCNTSGNCTGKTCKKSGTKCGKRLKYRSEKKRDDGYDQLDDGEIYTMYTRGGRIHYVACCDCGLVHREQFKILSRDTITRRCWRDEKETKKIRTINGIRTKG